MSTPTSVDQTVQRDRPLPDQAVTPGSPHTQDLAGGTTDDKVVNEDFASTSGPETPVVAAETLSLSASPSILHLSLSSSSSSPPTSSTEDSPREASSPPSSDYDFDSSEDDIYRSDNESENMPEGMAPVGGRKAESDNRVTGEDEKNQADTPATATRGWQPIRRQADTCLGAGWAPGDAQLPNRTFANEHIAVAESALQGHGVFAAADIREGTEVLMEAPLLRVRGLQKLCAKHALLGGEERAVYDGLVGYHEWETCPVRQKWSANSFDLSGAYNGVFAIASNFNHACKGRRNTKYDWDQRRQVMTFTATRDVEKGEEMLISYCGYRHVLKAVYGFVCHCGGCEHQEADLGANRW